MEPVVFGESVCNPQNLRLSLTPVLAKPNCTFSCQFPRSVYFWCGRPGNSAELTAHVLLVPSTMSTLLMFNILHMPEVCVAVNTLNFAGVLVSNDPHLQLTDRTNGKGHRVQIDHVTRVQALKSKIYKMYILF